MGRNLLFAVLIALVLVPGKAVFAASVDDDKDLEKVLQRLDEAAKIFKSASADFQFDSVTTEPIPETDVQKGSVYYERKGTAFQMAAHIREFNDKPAPKVYVYSGGVFKLYEPLQDQITVYSKASKFEGYLMLGFGASGKDLQQKWEIKYLGPDSLMDGKSSVKTEKLELVAKDPEVRKNLMKATIWVDPVRGVSMKQILDFSSSERKVCVYYNMKVNQSLPSDAFTFTFKPGSHPQVVNR